MLVSGEDVSVKAASFAFRVSAASFASSFVLLFVLFVVVLMVKSVLVVEVKSMSGVVVVEDCLLVFNKVKMRLNGL